MVGGSLYQGRHQLHKRGPAVERVSVSGAAQQLYPGALTVDGGHCTGGGTNYSKGGPAAERVSVPGAEQLLYLGAPTVE